jgi:ankyrin repeat protein
MLQHQGWTPLHFAATYGRESVIMLLTKNGADASITTNDGETPLHFSAHYDHKLITIALFEAGAPLDAKDKVR